MSGGSADEKTTLSVMIVAVRDRFVAWRDSVAWLRLRGLQRLTRLLTTHLQQPKWKEDKVVVDALEPLPGFNLRAQIVGQGGQYVKHIQHETGCRVQVKGRGSGFYETATSMEADEDMFIHITCVLSVLSASSCQSC